MGSAGLIFVVRVDPTGDAAVVENVRTRERVRLGDLARVGEQISEWIASGQRGSVAPGDRERDYPHLAE